MEKCESRMLKRFSIFVKVHGLLERLAIMAASAEKPRAEDAIFDAGRSARRACDDYSGAR